MCMFTCGPGATRGLARGKAIVGALGVRISFSGSSAGGVMSLWPMCWSMTSQAAGGGKWIGGFEGKMPTSK